MKKLESKNFGFIWAELYDNDGYIAFEIYRLDSNSGEHHNMYQDRDFGNFLMATEWIKKKMLDL